MEPVEFWQVGVFLFALLLLLPLALMLDFWPDRERLTFRGSPASREWIRQIHHEPHDEDHH